jgi:predicted O-methyltransferase YrrM
VTWEEFLATVDDSHQMTTAREHISELCKNVVGKQWRILELGSHAGISTAALAIAAPESTVVSVDLCDTVPEEHRRAYWHVLGLENVEPVRDDAGRFLRQSQLLLENWDFVFHDAAHGEAVMPEYLTAAGLTARLAIHDFEQLGVSSQQQLRRLFRSTTETSDRLGRVLFVGNDA